MPWNRIVNSTWNAFGFQMCPERIAFSAMNAQSVLMKDVGAPRSPVRNGEASDVAEHPVVSDCSFLSRCDVPRQVLEFYSENGRLQAIESRVDANDIVVVLF